MGAATAPDRTHQLPHQRVGDDARRTALRTGALPRVLIVNQHQLVGEILRSALTEDGLFDVVDPVARAGDALAAAHRGEVDVVLLDVESDEQSALQLLHDLRSSERPPAVLVLTSATDAQTVSAVMAAGASGYLTLDADLHDVREAVRSAAEGRVALNGRRLEALVRHLTRQRTPEPAAPSSGLTDRELAVLRLLVDGAATGRISEELGISAHTTRTHVQNVLMKLGVHSRLEAAAHAAAHGLV